LSAILKKVSPAQLRQAIAFLACLVWAGAVEFL
jgi:hypothetical protein